MRGAVVHNIASCLHNLGEMEAAQAYYDQAITEFKKAKTPLFERFFYGDANKRRIDFVKERLVDITWGRKPDVDKYLDENGNKRAVPDALAGGAQSGSHTLTERWREDGSVQPTWLEQGADGGGDDTYRAFDPNAGFVDPYRRGGPSRDEVPHVNSSQYVSSTPAYSGADESAGAYASAGAVVDDEEEARKEWLQYHMQVGEWDKAAELVVTKAEKDDLEYLIARERRNPAVGDYHQPGAPQERRYREAGYVGPVGADEDDGML